MALEVLRAAKSLGLAVPRQLSLVTFDDADWTSAIDPAVTVVAQPTYRLGFEAARMLIERIGGTRSRPRRCVLEATLIPRESVAAPERVGDRPRVTRGRRADGPGDDARPRRGRRAVACDLVGSLGRGGSIPTSRHDLT